VSEASIVNAVHTPFCDLGDESKFRPWSVNFKNPLTQLHAARRLEGLECFLLKAKLEMQRRFQTVSFSIPI
jgi:hypothetical protein